MDKHRLKQMIQLCELREQRASTSISKQRALVRQTALKKSEFAAEVDEYTRRLDRLTQYKNETNISGLRNTHLATRWLKYDDEKARYFLQKTDDELVEQTDEARQLSVSRQRIRDKRIRFSELLKDAQRSKSF